MPGRSKSFKITFTVLIVIVGCVLLVSIIGAIVDGSTKSKIMKAHDEALEYLSQYRKTGEGNAWGFYSKACEKARSIDVDFKPYLNGDIEITPEMMASILDNLEVITTMMAGSKMEFYSYPYEFEKGVSAQLPNFMSYRKATDLMLAKSLYDMERAKGTVSVDNLLTTMLVGKHIGSGVPLLIDHMIAIAIENQSLEVLEIGLSSGAYSKSEVERINSFLDRLEKEWPRIGWVIDGEVKMMDISAADIIKNPGSFLTIAETLTGAAGDVFRLFFLRLLCWRNFFSINLTLYRAEKFVHETIGEIEKIEIEFMKPKTEIKYNEYKERMETKVEEFGKKNFIIALAYPNFFEVMKRKLEFQTRVRAMHVAGRLCQFHIENGIFPPTIQEIGGDVIFDFNTGKMFQYKSFGDSVRIFSPGPDGEDQGDDVSITLTNLRIGKYLQRRREAFEKEKPKK